MKSVIVFIMFSLTVIFLTQAYGQDYPKGKSGIMSREKIIRLKTEMNRENPDWALVKQIYFEQIYDPELPDLIIYIPKNGNVKLGLVKGSEEVTELFGERFMWVMVLCDENLSINVPVKKGHRMKDSTAWGEVDLNVLGYSPEPREGMIMGVLKTVVSFIIGSVAIVDKPDSKAYKDSTREMNLRGFTSDNESLYVFIDKFPIQLNTKMRVVIRPPDHSMKFNFQYINYNFGNYEKSRLGVSLGVGYTQFFCRPDSENILNLYAFGHFYLRRPTLPTNSRSWSIVLGTNFITAKFLNNVILGIRTDMAGQGGFILGCNWFTDPEKVKRLGLFVGFDYVL